MMKKRKKSERLGVAIDLSLWVSVFSFFLSLFLPFLFRLLSPSFTFSLILLLWVWRPTTGMTFAREELGVGHPMQRS